MNIMVSTTSKYVVIGMILCAALFLAIFFYIPGEGVSGLDRVAQDWNAAIKGEGWTKVMKAAAALGSSTAIIVLTLLLTAAAALFIGIRKACWMIPGVAAAYLVNTVLKAWIGRPRPAEAWGIEAGGFSFPSASAMTAVVLYGMFFIWMARYARLGSVLRVILGLAAVLLIVLIGWSRIYFSVHYISDIIAGYAVGGLILLLLIMLDRKFGKSR